MEDSLVTNTRRAKLDTRRPRLAMFAAFLCLWVGTSCLWADSQASRAKKADGKSVKALKMALQNVTALEIDFTSDKLFIQSIPDGVTIQSGKNGIAIRETKIGPYIHTLKGKKLASGLEGVVIRDLIVSAIFGDAYSAGKREYEQANNDNHPPPCRQCHPCPEGMDCTPPADPPEGPGNDDCDPDTAPDGCECPQALLGVSCDETAESLLSTYGF